MKLRARRDEDKAERVAAILNAAREVWSRSSAFDFSVDEVAKRAGIVKGTVYLYFPSKEQLLLFVFESYLEEFLDDVDRSLAKRRGRATRADITQLLARCLRGRDAFLRLLPLISGSSDFIRERFTQSASSIEERLPNVDGLEFLTDAMGMFTGTAAMNALLQRGENKQ